VFHVAGCYFHSVERLLAGISYSYVINIHKAGSKLGSWGGGGGGGGLAETGRNFSKIKVPECILYEADYELQRKWVLFGLQFVACFTFISLCQLEGGGLDLRPYPGRKVCLSHLPHVSLRVYWANRVGRSYQIHLHAILLMGTTLGLTCSMMVSGREYCGNIQWFAVWQHNLLKREKQKNGNCALVTATSCCFD
jgi:hypothetical protein